MTTDRRGEAHLWLLLEEALLHVRRADVEPWEAWRNYRAVADALVVTGVVAAEVGAALVAELDDALALRAVIPAGAFTAAPWPELDVLTTERPAPPERAAVVWLEAEIERHLDLFASFGAEARTWAAADLVRILGGPVRAFAAVGMLDDTEGDLLDEVAATLAAVGVDAGRLPAPEATARDAWVDFLRAQPPPLPAEHRPLHLRRPRIELGRLGGILVRVDGLAWSDDVVDLEVTVRARPAADALPERTPWHARILDDRGHLHLGQPMTLRTGSAVLRFSLRPGLGPGVNSVDVRLTRGGERIEASISL